MWSSLYMTLKWTENAKNQIEVLIYDPRYDFKTVISGVMHIILDTIYCMSNAVIRLVSLNIISDIRY